MSHLLVIAGHAGVGKTTLARELCTSTGWTIIDKDTIAGGLVDALMQSLTGDPADRRSHEYLTIARPAEYAVTVAAACDALDHGAGTVVLVAPCVRDGDLDEIEHHATARSHSIAGVWVTCRREKWRNRLIDRACDRDRHKVANFDAWADSLSTPRLPSWAQVFDASDARSDSIWVLAGLAESAPQSLPPR